MTTQEAMIAVRELIDWSGKSGMDPRYTGALCASLDALSRQLPGPLSLEEFMNVSGEPVWVQPAGEDGFWMVHYKDSVIGGPGRTFAVVNPATHRAYPMGSYSNNWIAYPWKRAD